jgi:hypothetical protein
MMNHFRTDSNAGQTNLYRIRIKGHLNGQWSDWFDGFTVTLLDDGSTLLDGQVADQAALHGMLRRIRDLGMPLLSVLRVSPDQTDMTMADYRRETT